MIKAIIEGSEDPAILANMAKGKLRNKIEDLQRALKGLIGNHQKMILTVMLRHIEYLDKEIEAIDCEVKERMRPFEEEVKRLDAITGVGERSAPSTKIHAMRIIPLGNFFFHVSISLRYTLYLISIHSFKIECKMYLMFFKRNVIMFYNKFAKLSC